MIELEENKRYFLDFDGNLYGPKGLQKGAIDKGYRSMNLPIGKKDRKISLAKLVLKYLVDNPNGYTKYAFKDGNPLNCHPNNIMPISNEMDSIKRKFHINGIGNHKGVINTREYAIKNAQCPKMKLYYETLNIEIINSIFEEILQDYKNFEPIRKTIGKFYEIIYSMISRFALLYNPKKFILSSYHYHLTE